MPYLKFSIYTCKVNLFFFFVFFMGISACKSIPVFETHNVLCKKRGLMSHVIRGIVKEEYLVIIMG